MNRSPWVRPDHDLDAPGAIADFVKRFYRSAAVDDRLGPIFHDAGVDWAEHIPKLTRFWATVLLGEASYHGNPLAPHRAVHDRHPFGARELERWLELFDEALDETAVGPLADEARRRARVMATALEHLLRNHRAGVRIVPLVRPPA